MENIFQDIKKSLDVNTEDDAFDDELMLLLSTTFGIVAQLGAHESTSFKFSKDTTWDDYFNITNPHGDFELVKAYVLLKVRLAFDPPTASTLQFIKEYVKELEWRIAESFTGDDTYDDI